MDTNNKYLLVAATVSYPFETYWSVAEVYLQLSSDKVVFSSRYKSSDSRTWTPKDYNIKCNNYISCGIWGCQFVQGCGTVMFGVRVPAIRRKILLPASGEKYTKLYGITF